jgi:8-oxo-dGTP pyrophosphatase MutT (NUDIX family)
MVTATVNVMEQRAPERSEELRTKVFGERAVYENRWVRVTLVDIETPNGQRFEHHVVRLKTVAIAAVVDERDRVLMMWRHRFVTDEWGWELPGGIAEAGEDASITAAREVLEETGWRPGPLRHLFTFQPMPGMVDTPHALFVGNTAEKVGEPTDLEEAGVVDWVPMKRVRELIGRGEVLGSGSLVALLYLLSGRESAETTAESD